MKRKVKISQLKRTGDSNDGAGYKPAEYQKVGGAIMQEIMHGIL